MSSVANIMYWFIAGAIGLFLLWLLWSKAVELKKKIEEKKVEGGSVAKTK